MNGSLAAALSSWQPVCMRGNDTVIENKDLVTLCCGGGATADAPWAQHGVHSCLFSVAVSVPHMQTGCPLLMLHGHMVQNCRLKDFLVIRSYRCCH